jgi:cytochrome c2
VGTQKNRNIPFGHIEIMNLKKTVPHSSKLKNSKFLRTHLFCWSVAIALALTACTTRVETYQKYSNLPEPLPASEGQLIFEESKCVYCHGIQGDGNGFIAEGLNPQPSDFTTVASNNSDRKERWKKAIEKGIPGTSMPAFQEFSPNQIRDLIDYLESLSKIEK